MSVGQRPDDVVKPSRLNEQSKKAIDDVFKLIASKSQQGTEKLAKSENLKLEEEDYKKVGEAWKSATKKATKRIIKAIEDNPKTSENFNKLVSQTDNPEEQQELLLKHPVLKELFKKTLQKAKSEEPVLKELSNTENKGQSQSQKPEQKQGYEKTSFPQTFVQKIQAERENPTGLKPGLKR